MHKRQFLHCAVCFITLALLIGNAVSAADNAPGGELFNESAFITGIGAANVPEGHYQPMLLIWHLGMDLKKYFPSCKDQAGNLTFFIEPQFNPVFDPKTNFEMGVGVGLQYRHLLTERLSLYVLGTTGPHYISLVSANQANGFLFSNAVGGGAYFSLTKDSALNVGYRFRHMSNMGLETPNGGIDNHCAVIGFSRFF